MKDVGYIIRHQAEKLIKTQRAIIFALSSLSEIRDHGTGTHLKRIQEYSLLLAQLLRYSKKRIDDDYIRSIYDASVLHDIGKVGIEDAILLKNSSLTSQEFEIMKKHPLIGHKIFKSITKEMGTSTLIKLALEIILYHHENWDGSGYPDGLLKSEIPLSARIVTIGDCYGALTSKRPYKEAFSHEKSLAIMKENYHKFDPKIFKIFIENGDEFRKILEKFTE
jgi:putative two-component system response regulator